MSDIQSRFVAPTRTWTFFEGAWREGNEKILGVRAHGAWLGSVVFDGARAFDGLTPDLDRHFARVNNSAAKMLLEPVVSLERWLELAQEGLRRFAPGAQLYIRPMYWAEMGFGGGVRFDPATTNWCLSLYEAPMPPARGGAITLSPYRRPTAESAPVVSQTEAEPAPTPAPAPSETAAETTAQPPRRAGWWSRRFGGGE